MKHHPERAVSIVIHVWSRNITACKQNIIVSSTITFQLLLPMLESFFSNDVKDAWSTWDDG